MHSTRVAVLALTVAAAASFAQTCAGEIEASGDDKSLRSHREAQAQSRIDRIEIQEAQNSLPDRLLTGEAHGFGV
jgi:hypothetical protein